MTYTPDYKFDLNPQDDDGQDGCPGNQCPATLPDEDDDDVDDGYKGKYFAR